MAHNKNDYDELEQYDYSDGEYLEKVVDKYSPLVGLFLVNFSILEQDLNLAIADFMHDDCHETGFVIIEKLTTSNKIELFYKMYVRLESFKDKKNKEVLDKIKKQLETLNSFRNNIVHANWQSLTKGGFVRTKIVVDNQEGYVKFKKVKITPKIIRQKIKEIEKLINQIDKYKENAFQF
ncbi:hypothetical protein COY87_02255 [Candidatus Roizmanbacteria bacterium CG_4_10_14_0_8_um_filter_33_9]|uniref:RiboL-PSP-HEPN domain-containing protein n=1 Tax=Candidatus Roizmanbacteria bacterium CG_4_10_14_0_8_um_filter_33_9 TaxID=1974826 RepID=A0A2M7QJT9_9BACT|nr:MAG: hypothetical protein COY87_02255 [Candidatus Roizmanbacteria bacterium CG_4_10_14_0_8_um_filter_33_9]